MNNSEDVTKKVMKVLHSFINDVFNGEIKQHIQYESIPEFFIRDRAEESAFISKQLELSQKFMEEGNIQESRNHLLSVTSLIGKDKSPIKFNFTFDNKKYFIDIEHNMSYSSFTFSEADIEHFNYSADTKIASFGYSRVPIITDKFMSFIDNFKSFKETVKEDIEYINKNSFISLEDYKSKVGRTFSSWSSILKDKNYNEDSPCVYNDNDNKSYYKEVSNYEMIYHEDQNTVFVHVMNKNNGNHKIFNCSHIINIEFNERLSHITPNYFIENFEKESPFLLFDSFKGLNIKCEYSSRLKENLSILSIGFNEIR